MKSTNSNGDFKNVKSHTSVNDDDDDDNYEDKQSINIDILQPSSSSSSTSTNNSNGNIPSSTQTVVIETTSNELNDEKQPPVDSDTTSTKERTRDSWTGKLDFLMSALGYAVGLGAVWRFPYLCYKNGGGAFLIPYFIFLLIVGLPLVFLELAVGQFTSCGPINAWSCVPILKGIGISMNTVNHYNNIYYNMILAYSIYYLILSLRANLPWKDCDPHWSSSNCVDNFKNNFTYLECIDTNLTFKCDNGQCYNITSQFDDCNLNKTLLQSVGYWNPTFPSQDYWKKVILMMTDDIGNTGIIVWQLLIAFLAAWIIIFLMLMKGIAVSGKLVYFTAIFPYVILLILGIRGWMLEGAAEGIKFYIYPDFSRLSDYNVWTDAAVQIIFTLSVSYGGLLTLASYNDFHADILRDAIIVSVSNCFTSLFAGFVVFAYLGHLSFTTGLDIDKVVQAGHGLAYVVYPYAVTTIAGAPFWSICFFVMMLLLGLDTMMAGVETLITSIFDAFPALKLKSWKRLLSIATICFISFLMGLILCTQAGIHWINWIDSYSNNWAIFIVGFFETIAIGWIYGYNNFRMDVAAMLGYKSTFHWRFNYWGIFWVVITPLIYLVLIVISFIQAKRLEYDDGRLYPYWTDVIGNMMSASVLFGIIGWAIYEIIDVLFINKRPLKSLITPDEHWKPMKKEDQEFLKSIKDICNESMNSKKDPKKNGEDNLAYF